MYSCAAGKYQDDAGNKLEDVKQRTLVVHPIIAPKIITTNMNGSSASVKVCRPIQNISFIQFKPTILSISEEITEVCLIPDQFQVEEEFVFICQVQGDPGPSVVWFKDSEPVNQSKFIDITDYTLKIKYLRDEDSGVYTCEGSNRAGTVTRQLTLEVTGTIDIPAVIGEN